MGFSFEVMTLEVDESFADTTPKTKVAEQLATRKNKAYRKQVGDDVVLTADTIVILDNQILGKPENEADAKEMLQSLSGHKHSVITGVCISSPDKALSFSVSTEVIFNDLSVSEIQFYIEHFRPFDKAGAYGIQDWIGYTAVKNIRGCYYNVVGLPAAEVYQHLNEYFEIHPDGISDVSDR